jgi:hypothetical protein
MRLLRNQLARASFGIAIAVGLGLASTGCGDDNPSLAGDAPGSGSDGSVTNPTLTSFVIDLIKNHGTDPTPADSSTFSALPDPDGDDNNTAAYSVLFQ